MSYSYEQSTMHKTIHPDESATLTRGVEDLTEVNNWGELNVNYVRQKRKRSKYTVSYEMERLWALFFIHMSIIGVILGVKYVKTAEESMKTPVLVGCGLAIVLSGMLYRKYAKR